MEGRLAKAAAFGRLCVETTDSIRLRHAAPAAAFGRLCVETAVTDLFFYFAWQPPSGGCVLKLIGAFLAQKQIAAAAFGRLCVETWRKEDFSHLN